MNKALITLVLIFVSHSFSFSQIDGANVFGSNQILNIELTFSQTGYWDSLVANYATETWMMADVQITDAQGVHIYPSIGVRLKGNSSYGHPGNKKSFKIDFNEYVSGQNYDGLKKLNFNNCFKDPTFMREKLFFDVCKATNVPAPRVNYANVYMNGTFWGFYDVVEQIDDQFLDWCIQEDSGNLFKAGDNFGGTNLAADLVYYGNQDSDYTGRYELKTNETANDWTDIISLIDYINNSSDADFEYFFSSTFIDTNLLKSIALDNLFSNLDSYLNSARNYYIYHNMNTNKWEWIKWDANETFGLYNGGPGAGNLTELAPNYIGATRPLLQRIFENEALYTQYQIELCKLMNNFFNSTYMDAKADEIKVLIQSAVYADGNKQYSSAQFDSNIENDITISGGGPGGMQTIYGIKSFVADRSDYLSGQIDCSLMIHEFEKDKINVYPNPFNDELTLHSTESLETISIYNLQGQLLYMNNSVNAFSLTIPTTMYPSGIYLLKANGVNRKIVKP